MRASNTLILESSEDLKISIGEHEGTTHLTFWVDDLSSTFMLRGMNVAETAALLIDKLVHALEVHTLILGKESK